MRGKRKYFSIICLLLIICFMTGCWDKIEIESRSFISTIAVDVGRNINKEKDFSKVRSNKPFNEEEFKKINVTFGFPNISELGPGKGGTAIEDSIVTEGFSMEDAINDLSSKTSRSVYTGHSKLLILSDEIIQYPNTFKEILDYLERQPDINRTMLVVVAKGKAEDYVKFKPVMEKNIEAYISGLMQNGIKEFGVVPLRLNELLIDLYTKGNVQIPTIEFDKKNKNQLIVSGTALVNEYKLKGYFTSEEEGYLEMIKNKIKGGKETIIKEGHPIEFKISSENRQIKLVDDKDINNLRFKININLEGQLKEYYLGDSVFFKGKLNQIQEEFDDVIRRNCERVVGITQNNYGIDCLGLKDYIKKFKPSLYKNIENDWEKIYKNILIDINVKTRIRRIGVTK